MKVMNRILEQYLRAFVYDRPSQWFRFLYVVEWSYNTSAHSGIGLSPFEVIYGKSSSSIPHYILSDTPVEAVDSLLTMHAEILAGLYHRLLKAQITTKAATDAHRRDIEFAICDWVYVRLRPFRQTSLVPAYTKLTKRYYGHFQVIERIGAIAYRF